MRTMAERMWTVDINLVLRFADHVNSAFEFRRKVTTKEEQEEGEEEEEGERHVDRRENLLLSTVCRHVCYVWRGGSPFSREKNSSEKCTHNISLSFCLSCLIGWMCAQYRLHVNVNVIIFACQWMEKPEYSFRLCCCCCCCWVQYYFTGAAHERTHARSIQYQRIHEDPQVHATDCEQRTSHWIEYVPLH